MSKINLSKLGTKQLEAAIKNNKISEEQMPEATALLAKRNAKTPVVKEETAKKEAAPKKKTVPAKKAAKKAAPKKAVKKETAKKETHSREGGVRGYLRTIMTPKTPGKDVVCPVSFVEAERALVKNKPELMKNRQQLYRSEYQFVFKQLVGEGLIADKTAVTAEA